MNIRNTRIFLCILFVWCSFYISTAQNSLFKAFRFSQPSRAECIIQTSDSGVILSGEIGTALSLTHSFLMKVTAKGDTDWFKSYGGYQFENGYSVKQTSDGGYIFTGYRCTLGSTPYNQNVFLCRTDNHGNVLWDRIYQGEMGYDVIETPDKDFILVGSTYISNVKREDMLVIKTNSAGEMKWEKEIGGLGYDRAKKIIPTKDGGFLISGWTDSLTKTENYCLIKLNKSGNILWQKIYGQYLNKAVKDTLINLKDPYNKVTENITKGDTSYLYETITNERISGYTYCEPYDVKQTTDGGFMIVGSSVGIRNNQSAYVVKINSKGDLQWQKNYIINNSEPSEYTQAVASSVIVLSSGYFITGYTQVGKVFNIFTMNISASGKILTQKIYHNTLSAVAFSSCIGKDGSYYMTGYQNDSLDKILLLKTTIK